MNKREFIAGLQEALALKMDAARIREQVDFYSNYIEDEVRKGRKESEVIEELGEPWVIAKNLVGNVEEGSQYSEPTGSQSEAPSSRSQHNSQGTGGQADGPYVWSSNSTRGCWLLFGLAVLVLIIVLTVFVGVIRVLAPVLYPLIIILLLIRIFKK